MDGVPFFSGSCLTARRPPLCHTTKLWGMERKDFNSNFPSPILIVVTHHSVHAPRLLFVEGT